MYQKFKRAVAQFVFNRSLEFENAEGLADFNFELSNRSKPEGSSAILRVKNEETCIGPVLASIITIFDEIVFVDNGSTDNTLQIVKNIKQRIDKNNRVRILRYPFTISRCGDEHAETNEKSVHSLVYYYNWCLSKAKYNYAIKWDADMLPISSDSSKRIKQYLQGMQRRLATCEVPIQTVYIGPNGQFLKARNEINKEIQFFPNRPYVRFKKEKLWELLTTDFHIPNETYPNVDIYELKDTLSDEFSHWTSLCNPPKKQERI